MNNSLVEKKTFKKKSKPKLGALLRKAGLVSELQVRIALEHQKAFPHLRLGDILAEQGWIEPRTCDFFATKWDRFIRLEYRKPLGYYLLEAGLLEKSDVEDILSEQQRQQYRFGKIAVMKGHVKPSTVDFFLKYLFPEELAASSEQRTLKSLLESQRRQHKYFSEARRRSKSSTQRLEACRLKRST